MAVLIQASGIDRVLTMDLHAGQIQGFFDIPVDNLYAQPLLFRSMKEVVTDPEETVIVSPDAGGVERARSYAKRLGCHLAIIDKRRDKPNSAEVMHIVGQVKGRHAVIIDDMIDTAGTLTKGCRAIAQQGAKSVTAYATHPVLSGPAISRIEESRFEKVFVTDTIPLGPAAIGCDKVQVLSVASLFAEAIRAIHFNDSISRLFLDEDE
jgi:ribose-phosphate pyrophosphokinase